MGLAERAETVQLFPTERRILTQLIAIDPLTLGSMTSSDLSEKSGASRSSIDRLSRKLGYSGLKDMRRSLLEEAKTSGGRFSPANADASTPAGMARDVLSNLGQRIDPFLRSLSQPGLLDQLVDWLLAARCIGFFGAGESAAVCSALYLRLMRLGLPVQFSQEHHTQVSVAGMMRPGDLAIIVSYSGRSKSVVWAARTAKDAGAHVVAISSATSSPLSKMSDLHVALPGSEGFQGSSEIHDRILSVALGQILFDCVAARRPDMLESAVHVDDLFGEDRL
ncbi:MurR/RpiR family transcriptional regulator [Psychromarinibacter sp. S121]|uniref:MurR/RpiR family transcriptional regulator n=1 Tax=Psychromarinibacter sp. S121 TaxID=3415127 RepID=UPI003C7A7C28